MQNKGLKTLKFLTVKYSLKKKKKINALFCEYKPFEAEFYKLWYEYGNNDSFQVSHLSNNFNENFSI